MDNFQYIYKELEGDKSIFYGWFAGMHTRIDLVICNTDEKRSIKLINKVIDEIIRIENLGNRFDHRSELSKVNQTATLYPVKVSDELFLIIKEAYQGFEKTHGCFDITINSINYQKEYHNNIVFNKEEKTIFFTNKNITLDLNGYLKGYVLDRIIFLLKGHGITDALVNLGNSSVAAIGNHPNGKGWLINNPSLPSEEPITLYDECLTTSGNDFDERKHIISPFTGKFIAGKKSVYVISKSGAEGEILSTALFVSKSEDIGHNPIL